jgi:dihydrofolate reductase
MRKLIVSNLISLDGYASGPGGDVMALPFDTTFSDYNLELMQAADTLVSGATTYRGFVSYWPPIADDPAQPEVERAISRCHRELEHMVVSNSLTAQETGAWRDKTRIVRRGEARDAIAQAKEGEGGTLLVFGSMTTWNDLLAAGLVDELHMMVGAGVVIDGFPAFSVRPPGSMQLTGARQLGDSNIALLQYSLG